MKKFKLFMGCLGNGITVCNKAVEEHGDYKHIAHISDRGNIKFYVKENYIPETALNTIKETAQRERKKFLNDFWNTKTDIQKYSILLDALPYSVKEPITSNKNKTLAEKVTELTAYYMTA